jgi:peptidoglycan hydrolase-like protein with peptidoglycan-binding domain
MKKKLHITERNFINLIRKIVLEQTDDMNSIEYLTQRDAEQQKLAQPTPIAQPRTQGQVDCPGGYEPPTNDVYGLCSGGPLVGKLQQYLGFPKPDNKFGPITKQALVKKTNKTTITKDEIEKLSKSSAATSVDAINQNVKQNNLGIVVNLKNVEPNTSFEKAFVTKTDKGEIINITDYRGATFFSTSCKAMETSKFWNLGTKKYDDFSKFSKLINKLKYNFCSKRTTNINVTNIIKNTLEISAAERRRFKPGNNYRAVIINNSIYILTESNDTIFFTDCNNLKNNTFFRNYGQANINKKPIVLPQLAKVVLPLCNK